MSEPSEKSAKMEEQLDDMSLKSFGRSRTGSIARNACVICGEDASEFKDELSRKEFTISGMCQSCQDKTFG